MQLFAWDTVFIQYQSKKYNMKKSIILSAIAFVIAVAASAGTIEKETRDLRNFKKVSFGISGDLFISFGDFNVTLEGNKDDLEEIKTVVSDGRLVIKQDNWNFRLSKEKIIIHITMPAIEGLSVSGSGKAEITDAVKEADGLDLSVSGSGRLITNNLTADNINMNISGSGNILIKGSGTADKGEIGISGSGNYDGDQLEIDKLRVKVSGSGNCTCRAGDSLSASISGSGNVYYLGNPELDARVSGSGKVRSR